MQQRTIAIACAIAGLASGAPEMAAAQTTRAASDCASAQSAPVDEASARQAATAVLCLVNRERAQRGRRSLRASSPLGAAATRHSLDMVARKFFSHVGSDGSSLRQRVARTGYTRGAASALVGETLAWGSGPYTTPAQIVARSSRAPTTAARCSTGAFVTPASASWSVHPSPASPAP